MRRAQAQYGGIKQFFVGFLVVCTVFGLVAWVGYLLADLNHRRFRLLPQNGQLVVERGLYLPMGFAPYVPGQDALVQAYAPIIPLGQIVGLTPRTFEDRSELDRALFELLGGWAKQGFASGEAAQTPQAVFWVSRLELLPSLSEHQRADLRQLRTTASFAQAEAFVHEHQTLLQKALAAYDEASNEPGPKGRLAQHRLIGLQRCMTCLHDQSSPVQKPADEAAAPP